jgi:hypothetical protein
MPGLFILLCGRLFMNTLTESGSYNFLPAAPIITTLYDLMTVIDSEQGNQPRAHMGFDVQGPNNHGHTGSVIERVALMFESGQIRFRNTQDFQRNYAELFIDGGFTSR